MDWNWEGYIERPDELKRYLPSMIVGPTNR